MKGENPNKNMKGQQIRMPQMGMLYRVVGTLGFRLEAGAANI